jgi:carbon monoxide dehydrogenase subunit G
MPYETTVPVHRRLLWPAVTDAGRLMNALPGAVIEAADGAGVAGRFRLRAHGQSVTFHGVARIVEVTPATLSLVVEIEAAFSRASGAVEGLVGITLRAADSGTLVTVRPDLQVSGNLAWSGQAPEATGQRLVERWFANLAATSPTRSEAGGPADSPADGPDQPERPTLSAVPDLAAGGDLTASGAVPLPEPVEPDRPTPPVEHPAAALRLVPEPVADQPESADPPQPAAPRVPEPEPDDAAALREAEHDLWSRPPVAARLSRWIPAILTAGAFAFVAIGALARKRLGRIRRRSS